MTKADLINRTINSFVRSGLVDPFMEGELRKELLLFYQAANETASMENHSHKKRAVVEMDASGNIIEQYGSFKEASKRTGCGRTGLYKRINYGVRDKSGHLWKYL